MHTHTYKVCGSGDKPIFLNILNNENTQESMKTVVEYKASFNQVGTEQDKKGNLYVCFSGLS